MAGEQRLELFGTDGVRGTANVPPTAPYCPVGYASGLVGSNGALLTKVPLPVEPPLASLKVWPAQGASTQ